VISFIVNFANPESGFSGILCVQPVTTAILLKLVSMNNLDPFNLLSRGIADSAEMAQLAAGMRLVTRDRESLESRLVI